MLNGWIDVKWMDGWMVGWMDVKWMNGKVGRMNKCKDELDKWIFYEYKD